MQKHVLDRPKTQRKSVLPKAIKIEMQSGPHRTTLELQRRARNDNTPQRLKHFTRIEKGETD